MAEVLLAFGANLGDPPGAIAKALALLDDSGVAILAVSSLYRTAPWGHVQQPDFINACARARTALAPRELLALCQEIERACGRVHGPRWGPRALDIDILDYDGLVLDEPGLTLPHPHIAERAFVLVPLAEIGFDRRIGGRSVADMLAGLDASDVTRLATPAPR